MTAQTTVFTTEHEFGQIEAIEEFVVAAYGTRMEIHGTCGSYRHRRVVAGPFAVETADHTTDLEFHVDPLNSVVVTRASTARLERTCGSETGRYEPGDIFMMAHADRAHRSRWLPGEISNCLIDPELLTRIAAPGPGRLAGPIRFTSLEPRDRVTADHWWATHDFVVDLLALPEAAAEPLLLATASQLLAAATLATFPNTAVAAPSIEERRDAHPATVRRATAYIEQHAHEDIAVADIATAARVGVRTIQLAFRRHLGTTPLQHLRMVRLDRAHHDLIEADPATTTVTAIAMRWGFGSASRFAASYRRAYGLPPAETLHLD